MDDLRRKGKMQQALAIRNTLVEQNRPYAVVVACDFHRKYARGCDLQDLIQCACEGLTKAVWKFNPRASKTYKLEDFDPKKGAFTGYASRYVLAELRKWSRKDRVIYKPLHEDVPKAVKEKYREIEKKKGRPPTKKEMGPLAPGTTIPKIQRALEPNPVLVSMDEPRRFASEEAVDINFHELLPSQAPTPEEIMIRQEEEFSELLTLSDLPREEFVAVTGYVVEERSYSEVGSRMVPRRTTAEVKALVASGLERLRKRMGVK